MYIYIYVTLTIYIHIHHCATVVVALKVTPSHLASSPLRSGAVPAQGSRLESSDLAVMAWRSAHDCSPRSCHYKPLLFSSARNQPVNQPVVETVILQSGTGHMKIVCSFSKPSNAAGSRHAGGQQDGSVKLVPTKDNVHFTVPTRPHWSSRSGLNTCIQARCNPV